MPGLDAEQIDMWDYWDESPPKTDPATTMDNVQEFAKVTGQSPNPEMSADLMMEEWAEWHKAFNYESEVEELKELADLVYVIYGYANSRGWNLDEAIMRVHHNNIGRCLQPDGTVKRRGDGKILKNLDYPAVDLSDLV